MLGAVKIRSAFLAAAGAALLAAPSAAADGLSLGGYFLGDDAPAAETPRPLGGGVVSFTPRIAGFRLGPLDIGLGATWDEGDQQFAIGAPIGREWSAGASVGWIGFTLSGALERGEQDRMGLNLQYDAGPWTLSMGGGQASAENPLGGDSRQLQLEIGASYTFGPGVLSSFGVQTYAPGEETLLSGEDGAVYFTGGLKLRF